MRLLLFLLSTLFSQSTAVSECPPDKECMAIRFCPRQEVKRLDPERFCGDPGFYRYCCSPQIRDFPEEEKPKEPSIQDGKVKCLKDSDCPTTELPTRLQHSENLVNEQVQVYRCRETPSHECMGDYDDLNDYIACIGEQTCQTVCTKFCFHPEGRKNSECQIKEGEPVYTLTKEGHIECDFDSDCPPTALPNWEWNEVTKVKYGVKSITEMLVYQPYCAPIKVVRNEFFLVASDPSNITLCTVKTASFCDHQLGKNHPECQRCNVLTPIPDPQCLDFAQNSEGSRLEIDRCCTDLFNGTLLEELKAQVPGPGPDPRTDFIDIDPRTDRVGSDRIRPSDPIRGQISLTLIEDVMRNFTVKDCQLSGLHLPPSAPPRTSFDPYNICCSLGTYYCPDSTFDEVVGGPTSFASGVTGIGSLIPKGLGQILAACPFGHCKRPSLAKPGKLVCCLLIRAPWAHARIAVCPHSCD